MGYVWEQIEATPSHITYLILSTFLISYALGAAFIRNRLHLSEPPIALLVGIALGPIGLGWLTPNLRGVLGEHWKDNAANSELGGWGWGDDVIQETARIIVGVQVFTTGLSLPRHYIRRHWKSVLWLVGPIMAVSWLICAAFVTFIFDVDFPTALTVAACLTPTDPVLSSSILSNSQFSNRVPKRIKDMLSAESGVNDGTAFPFLFAGLVLLTKETAGEALKKWFLITILWQCCFGLLIGLTLGTAANRILRISSKSGFMDPSGFIVFYLLLAILSVGIGSTLGADDFLVAFGCGYGFARDGWFSKKTKEADLPDVIDLLLNSAMFVYLGAIVPWYAFMPTAITPSITPGKLVGFLVLVLLFRRLPIVLAAYKGVPDIRTLREALFCGHFGPMGLGAIFLAIEARAQLENGTSLPEKNPPEYGYPYTNRERAVHLIWPLVCFIVLGSTLVHGFSVAAMSIYSHFKRPKEDRAGILAAETDPLGGMEHSDNYGDSVSEDSEED